MNIAGKFFCEPRGSFITIMEPYTSRTYAVGKCNDDKYAVTIVELDSSNYIGKDGLFSIRLLSFDMIHEEIKDELIKTFQYFPLSTLHEAPYWLLLSHTMPLIELVGCILNLKEDMPNKGAKINFIITDNSTNNFTKGMEAIKFNVVTLNTNIVNINSNDIYTAIYSGVRCGIFHTSAITSPRKGAKCDISIVPGKDGDAAIEVESFPSSSDTIKISTYSFAVAVKDFVLDFFSKGEKDIDFLEAVFHIWRARWGRDTPTQAAATPAAPPQGGTPTP